MKLNNGIVGASTLFALVFLYCQFCKVDNKKSPGPDTMKENPIVSTAPLPIAEPQINKDSITKRIGVLVGNFREEKDEFRKISFYQPKHIGKYWPRRKAVYAYCNSEGGVFLVSNWYSDDWIFHNSITFLIGDETLTTDVVPDYSDNKDTDINDGVYEHITFTNELPIFRAVSENGNMPIKVRFNGKKGYFDITLSQSDKNSIKTAYELSECLRALK